MNHMILIDNYDSFTYNLLHSFAKFDVPVDVVRNDIKSPEEILKSQPSAIIISPGPCTPDDTGICLDLMKLIEENAVPLFGVCLGHQVIGQYFGANIVRAQTPMHGKLSTINHFNKGVFKNIPANDVVTRYHSLIIDRGSLPDTLEVTAETDDGIIMGVQHTSLPIHGIQFHPESIATENGNQMIKNFIDMVGA